MSIKIIGVHVHDSYQGEFCKIPGIEMYHITNKDKKQKLWGGGARPKPNNLFEVPYENLEDINWSNYDLMITQSLEQYEQFRQLPIKKVVIEHTLSYPLYQGAPHQWMLENDPYVRKIIFLSEEQAYSWRIKNPFEVEVIPSCIDVSLYPEWEGGEQQIFTAVNELPNRDWCCGAEIFKQTTQGLPRILAGEGNENIGKNPLLSKYADSKIKDLNERYGGVVGFKTHEQIREYFLKSALYLNTNKYSTLPFALMEAMAYGMPIVSTDRNTASVYLNSVSTPTKKQTGILSNILPVLRSKTIEVLNRPEEFREMGKAAREAAKEYFNPERFIAQWQGVLEEVC